MHATRDGPRLERLADAEVCSPLPLLRITLEDESFDRVELHTDVQSHRTNRCVVSNARAYGPAQRPELHLPRTLPHVAAVHEQHASKFAANTEPCLRRHLHHRPAADRLTRRCERTDLIPAPAANAARPT